MSRARVLIFLVAAVAAVAAVPACSFRSPSATGDGSIGDDDAPDAGSGRCDLPDTWEAGKQPTKTIYVSKTAGPDTPDGSQTNPYISLDDAAAAITAGTKIVLGPGNFAGATFTDKRGTADAPIWLEGSTGGSPSRINSDGLHLVGAQYWVIRNLAIGSFNGEPGLNVDDTSGAGKSHHIVVDRVNVGSTDRPCLQFSGVTDVTIRDSTLGSCERGVFLVGVQRATIGRATIGSMQSSGIAMAGGSADIEVRQSTISDVPNGRGLWIGGDSDADEFRPPLSALSGNTEATNVRVFDNVIFSVKDAIECSICTNTLVAHNLLRGVTRDVLNLYQPYTAIVPHNFARSGGVRLVNNAIEVGGGGLAVYEGNNTDPGSCSFSHNMWYRSSGTWMPTLPVTEEAGIYDKQSGYTDKGSLCASANSPAAAAGASVPGVPGTLQGACRPTSPPPPSIGPSEPDSGC